MIFLLLPLVVSLVARANSNTKACIQDPVKNTSTTPYPGGSQYTEIDQNVLTAAQICNQAWNQNYSQASNYFAVTCVRNVRTQVVAGVMYHINVTLAETVCAKAAYLNGNLNNCTLKTNGINLNCLFDCWVQSWKDSYTLRPNTTCLSV